jgi:VIT1/CCC1 family predicted Fe2+/Mn2+ transporter
MGERLIYNHAEHHFIHRTGWLRAAVLGANDGIISTASLIIGVASASASHQTILITGMAGLVAGAISMAAGEYVSVSSQSDLEIADLNRERKELLDNPKEELEELADIYKDRGLSPALALQVAEEMTAKDAITAHARDELGIRELTAAKPMQAALSSGIAFSGGALIPLLVTWFIPSDYVVIAVALISSILLGILGYIGAYLGGAKPLKPTLRVMFWGVAAMAITALIGHFMGGIVPAL